MSQQRAPRSLRQRCSAGAPSHTRGSGALTSRAARKTAHGGPWQNRLFARPVRAAGESARARTQGHAGTVSFNVISGRIGAPAKNASSTPILNGHMLAKKELDAGQASPRGTSVPCFIQQDEDDLPRSNACATRSSGSLVVQQKRKSGRRGAKKLPLPTAVSAGSA